MSSKETESSRDKSARFATARLIQRAHVSGGARSAKGMRKNKMTECLFSVEGRRRLIDTRNTYAPHIQLHRAPCLIFLSSRVNIWHKEALDSARGRFKPDTGWGKRGGHERGPSWIQQAPRVKFQTTGRVILHTHTHGHTLLVP